MKYPEYAEVKGVQYKINTDYRVALRCFEVIEDNKISDEERAYAVVFLLFGEVPPNNMEDFLRIAGAYLRFQMKQRTFGLEFIQITQTRH